ncbi:cupin domain-containing protein [Congregibacter sp.]|uniref:cupin domain-containing protein n=1 Tax=Congregibacter sp. TaxID=2744308 RepID=UPI00385B4D6F
MSAIMVNWLLIFSLLFLGRDSMKAQLTTSIVSLLLCLSVPIGAAETSSPTFQVTQRSELTWTPVPDGLGAEFAVLRGNPAESGVYVIRVRFPAGVMDTPHFHSQDRHVTVIEGSWYAGIGDVFDPTTAKEITAGGYMFHPAGAAHWDGARGDSDAVVQIIGNGPVSSEQSNSGEAMWVRVHE